MKEKIKNFLKSRSFKIALLIIAGYVVFAAAVMTVADGRHIRFYMYDEQEISVEYGSEYTEPGVEAVTVGRILGEGERKLPVEARGKVDSHKLGKYELEYAVNWLFREYKTARTVTVVDTTPPEIELKYIEGYTASWFTGYEDEGYTATDLCDGDLTTAVKSELSGDTLIYTVTDSSGNTATAERKIEYSVTEPVISLIGSENTAFTARMNYTDPGFSATDSLGNDLTEYVKVEGEVIPHTAGEYHLKYYIENDFGERVEKLRTVTVHPATGSDSVTPSEKTIYLTFDDGPGPYTDWLLDILAAYDAEATFFVTGLNPKYEDCIGRAYREGHAIGVHTLSHNYYDVYSSEEAFFADFNAVQDMIYRQTGEYTALTRFPGGSSNTVSSFNQGIMSRLSVALEDMGYKYFDWNVTSGDAGGTTDTDTIVENIIGGIAGRRWAVVLQHDIKDYSVAAVEAVLIWGRNNGYVFRALNETSPTAHHGIAN